MISKKLSDCFGVEISKIDLTLNLSIEEINSIKKLFQDSHLIVFKEQSLKSNDTLYRDIDKVIKDTPKNEE